MVTANLDNYIAPEFKLEMLSCVKTGNRIPNGKKNVRSNVSAMFDSPVPLLKNNITYLTIGEGIVDQKFRNVCPITNIPQKHFSTQNISYHILDRQAVFNWCTYEFETFLIFSKGYSIIIPPLMFFIFNTYSLYCQAQPKAKPKLG